MTFIVEMMRGLSTEHTPEGFECTTWQWADLQRIAKTYGWQPAGTDYDGDRIEELREDDRHSYHADEWLHARKVREGDARLWAEALERAADAMEQGELAPQQKHPGILNDTMTSQQVFSANMEMSPPFLRTFASFLKRGPFEFGVDD